MLRQTFNIRAILYNVNYFTCCIIVVLLKIAAANIWECMLMHSL